MEKRTTKVKLRYFVVAPVEGGRFKPFKKELSPISINGYVTRSELLKHFDDHIRIPDINQAFPLSSVIAEPKKKNSLLEIILSIFGVWALLYFIPTSDTHFPLTRWGIAVCLSWALGLSLGRLRISFQQADADYFNRS